MPAIACLQPNLVNYVRNRMKGLIQGRRSWVFVTCIVGTSEVIRTPVDPHALCKYSCDAIYSGSVHPNAVSVFRSFRDQFNASLLIVADFGRYQKTTAHLRKDVVAPYVHILPTFENDTHLNPFESRTTLLYFQGRVRRKDVSVSPNLSVSY